MEISSLPTPALILDMSRLSKNAQLMRERAKNLGVALRPHMKTSKCIDVMKVALEGLPQLVTVSTLTEAEYFFEHGVSDITLAVGISVGKINRAMDLIARGAKLKLLTDNLLTAEKISQTAQSRELNAPVRVLIEIDCGDNRCGISADNSQLLEMASALKGSNVELEGILTHAGQSYFCQARDEVIEVAETERATAVKAADKLRNAGFECNTISVGSTPTASHVVGLDGVTEMRPGVYLFGDLFQVHLESMTMDRVALSVLTSVIGIYEKHLVIDAGGLALSKDPGNGDCGFGQLADIEGNLIEGAYIQGLSQEHGTVNLVPALASLKVGDRLRVFPNHVCMTAAAHDRYYVVDGGQQVVSEWQRCNGWS